MFCSQAQTSIIINLLLKLENEVKGGVLTLTAWSTGMKKVFLPLMLNTFSRSKLLTRFSNSLQHTHTQSQPSQLQDFTKKTEYSIIW